MMIRSAVIGLGAMGAGMAGNLHRAGLLVGAWNRTRQRGEAAAAAHGFVLSGSLAEAVQTADLALTCVAADQDLLAVAGQLAPLLPAGAVAVDASTVSSDTAKEAAAVYRKHGAEFLDSPVSGGREGAEQGTLVMMAGGNAEALARILPALEAISSRVVHMGPVGSGQATKAVNQIMVAGINHAVTEALAFGQSRGLPMDKVMDAVGGGAAGNWFLAHRGSSMCDGRFAPGFRLALHHKDLKICQSMLAEQGVSLPVVEMTLVHYERLMAAGCGDQDISVLFRNKRALFEQ